jgi:aldehyde:ferredoxin oxidoreductase
MANFNFTMLEVDLTTGKSRVLDVTREMETYMGGNGLGNKLIWDLTAQGTDPLSAENILHIGVGPITGLVGCKTSCSFLSPLTGWAGESTISGYLGDEIMRTKYNGGILIRGKASKPSYLYVYNDKVEIRNASDLWGQYLVKTENTLRRRLYKETGQEFSVLSIGPAGENLVRFANAVTENMHSASKNGIGAVFGSKNLKAVAVKGTGTYPYADHKKVWELKKYYVAHPETMQQKFAGWGRFGASSGMRSLLNWGGDAIKNAHGSWDRVADRSDMLAHQLSYHVWTDGCPGCATPCFMPFFKNTPYGAFSGEIRHGNTAGLCGNGMMGYDEVEEINSIHEELGVDAEDLQGLVAWAMDLYEHGIVSKEDLGGIDLKWGDKEATKELMKNIIFRKGGAPSALAEGYVRAIKVFGPESARYAWHSSTNASIPRYDPRNKKYGMAMNYGLSHGGGSGIPDCATMCFFAAFAHQPIWGPPNEIARVFLTPACGWELNQQQIGDMVQRNSYLSRSVSIRAGFHPDKHAGLPPRAFEEPIINKYGEKWVWTQTEWETAKKNQYTKGMKLTERGLPLKEELKRLGLEFVIPTLIPLDGLG